MVWLGRAGRFGFSNRDGNHVSVATFPLKGLGSLPRVKVSRNIWRVKWPSIVQNIEIRKRRSWKQSDQWWFEFTYEGKRYREPAKTTRKTIATEAEKKRRLQLERARPGPGRASAGIASRQSRNAPQLTC